MATKQDWSKITALECDILREEEEMVKHDHQKPPLPWHRWIDTPPHIRERKK
jgi:hypothetical protein